jgi:hypothetical protein
MTMTYTTEEERRMNIIISLIPQVEQLYATDLFGWLRDSYRAVHNAIAEMPVEARMDWIKSFEIEGKEIKPSESIKIGELSIMNIMVKLFGLIFTLTHKDLKEDMIDAMKSIKLMKENK